MECVKPPARAREPSGLSPRAILTPCVRRLCACPAPWPRLPDTSEPSTLPAAAKLLRVRGTTVQSHRRDVTCEGGRGTQPHTPHGHVLPPARARMRTFSTEMPIVPADADVVVVARVCERAQSTLVGAGLGPLQPRSWTLGWNRGTPRAPHSALPQARMSTSARASPHIPDRK